LLIVPGLRDSGPAHWQTWLQQCVPGSVRVVQDDWHRPDIDIWADRIEQTIHVAGRGPWLVAAHSFGCLALMRLLARQSRQVERIQAALLVAPAEPDKFGVAAQLPQQAVGLPCTLIASTTDPWMSLDSVMCWANRWGARTVNLGDAGHINAESGFGPLPLARRWIDVRQQRWNGEQRRHAAEGGW
jgi:hypothetical protein